MTSQMSRKLSLLNAIRILLDDAIHTALNGSESLFSVYLPNPRETDVTTLHAQGPNLYIWSLPQILKN